MIEKPIFLFALLSILGDASAKWTDWTSSLPAKSAIVRANFRMW
jgi:hypothetical protein